MSVNNEQLYLQTYAPKDLPKSPSLALENLATSIANLNNKPFNAEAYHELATTTTIDAFHELTGVELTERDLEVMSLSQDYIKKIHYTFQRTRSSILNVTQQSNDPVIKDFRKNLKDSARLERKIQHDISSQVKKVYVEEIKGVQDFKTQLSFQKKKCKSLQNKVHKMQKTFLSNLNSMNLFLKEAEKLGISPHTLSENQLNDFMTSVSERFYEEFLAEESSSVPKAQTGQAKLKKGSSLNNTPKKPAASSLPNTQKAVPQKSLPILRQTKLNEWLNTGHRLHFDPRIERWNTEKLESIKSFRDPNPVRSLGPVQRYKDYELEELQKMQDYHYLPGTPNLLFNDIYSVATRSGRAMMCRMQRKNLPMAYGALKFGLNNDDVYHMFFEENDSTDSTISHLFKDTDEETPAHEEEWGFSLAGKYTSELLEDGIIRLTYPNERYIEIYPVRKHLLPSDLFNADR